MGQRKVGWYWVFNHDTNGATSFKTGWMVAEWTGVEWMVGYLPLVPAYARNPIDHDPDEGLGVGERIPDITGWND